MVHLKALIRKNFLTMKAERKKSIAEMIFNIAYGVLIGYEASLSFNGETQGAFGYIIFLLITPVAFQQSCVFIFNEMVKDRESKMKESLQIMGLNKYMYALSFLIQRTLWVLVTTLLIAIMVYAFNSEYISFGQFIQLFLAMFLLATAFLALSLAVQNLFSDFKLASIAAPFMLFLPCGLAMLGIIQPSVNHLRNNWIPYLFWLPSFPFEVVLVSIFEPDMVTEYFIVSAPWAWAALVLAIPFYFFLHIYLEAIIPDAYGVTETCCFCFRRSRVQEQEDDAEDEDFFKTPDKMKTKESTIQDDEETGQLIGENFRESLLKKSAGGRRSTTERRQTEARKAFDPSDPIQLRKMTKQFGDFRAVDSLTLSIKTNEIIALLGHNGAGKTTAIYMLTGMLMPTQGDALIHGKSIKRETDLVRRQIGLCQQHDVLFDLVSVEEHLRLTMRVRSNEVNVANEDRLIDEILQQVMLTEHKAKLVKELSGGMKRKLSLGMALIGGTKTIILDEPTSGLDVESRQQVWELIRRLKENRSIIMSTQHIEEADELADRVCIMSHGKVIALGTPANIKRRFGVGYNLYVEPRDSSNLNQQQLQERLLAVDRVFLNRQNLDGIKKSKDSTDKNSLFHIPISLLDRIGDLIREVEQDIPEMQVDIELNSLEDAFIKIAEKDIEQEMQENRALAQAQQFMTQQEEETAFQDYKNFEGEQSFMQKVLVIFLNRLKVFVRSSFQWYVLFVPMLYVVIQLFIAYSIIVSIVDGSTAETFISIFFTFYFTFFLVLGQSFTAGLYGQTPITEKKMGLRQMMHMSGLSSLEYYLGLILGDICLFTVPAVVISLVLIAVPQIMVSSSIGPFFISFVLYGLALINQVYCFMHLFDNPDTALKYVALIFFLVLLLIPIALSMIFAAIFGFSDSVGAALGFWYWIDPQVCFVIQLYTLCCLGKPDLDDFKITLSGGVEPTTGLYCGVILAQTILIFVLNIFIDRFLQNRHKRRGGRDGEAPPMLDIRQDVLDHADEVRRNANLQQDDDNAYQIKAIDICKTYPSGERMAVCRNTFGVQKGQVFGLLGPNGAGKSTTFSMIAMQHPITSGEAELMGHEIRNFPLNELGKFFGQCNQENLIWESLTVDESMNFIASMKGISGERRERVKRLIMETLELNFFKNTISKNLSGGNKRKLCCAQALMLCPRVLFLDEPTSGVDPVSRRSLNRMVKKMKMASVLLTTHRMDEAEQLCDKLAIMINGRFVVLGSPNYLKTQYGHGYTFEVTQEHRLFHSEDTNVRRLISERIPTAQLVHDSSEGAQGADNPDQPPQILQKAVVVTYRIEGINIEGSQVLLSQTFSQLAQLQKDSTIKDFSLTRTNLEQVFINFAKFQIQAAADGIPAVADANAADTR